MCGLGSVGDADKQRRPIFAASLFLSHHISGLASTCHRHARANGGQEWASVWPSRFLAGTLFILPRRPYRRPHPPRRRQTPRRRPGRRPLRHRLTGDCRRPHPSPAHPTATSIFVTPRDEGYRQYAKRPLSRRLPSSRHRLLREPLAHPSTSELHLLILHLILIQAQREYPPPFSWDLVRVVLVEGGADCCGIFCRLPCRPRRSNTQILAFKHSLPGPRHVGSSQIIPQGHISASTAGATAARLPGPSIRPIPRSTTSSRRRPTTDASKSPTAVPAEASGPAASNPEADSTPLRQPPTGSASASPPGVPT